jgi:hypothetical protein
VDFESEVIPLGNAFYPFLHKRESFAHEQEVRAVIMQLPIGDDKTIDWSKSVSGLSVPVDLRRLVKGVYLAPNTPSWVHELVESILHKYRLRVPLHESALAGEPIY